MKPGPKKGVTRADLVRGRKEAPLAVVIPPINSILQDANTIIAAELSSIKQDVAAGGRLSTYEAKKLRDLMATLAQGEDVRRAAQAEADVGSLSAEELDAELSALYAEKQRAALRGDEGEDDGEE